MRGRRSCPVVLAAALAVLLPASQAVSQEPAPAALRAALEGTWQLEEWHVDGQVLTPPQANGRWSLHDGVVLFMLHRSDTAESTMGYGEYRIDARTWRYRYERMQRTTGPAGGPFTVSVSPPQPAMRVFTITRGPGTVTLDDGDARHEYDGTFFTLRQQGRVVRKWRRIEPADVRP